MKRRVNVEGVPRLPAFSHAVQVDDHIYVAGTLGTDSRNAERRSTMW
jgi:hypothetical protein